MRIELPAKDKRVVPIIKATFPNYRRHSVIVDTSGACTLQDLNWSGGTRSEYRACTVPGILGSADTIPARRDINAPHPLDNMHEGQTCVVPVGAVVVQGGHFCGRVSRLNIYINDVDWQRALAAA